MTFHVSCWRIAKISQKMQGKIWTFHSFIITYQDSRISTKLSLIEWVYNVLGKFAPYTIMATTLLLSLSCLASASCCTLLFPNFHLTLFALVGKYWDKCDFQRIYCFRNLEFVTKHNLLIIGMTSTQIDHVYGYREFK